MQHTLSPEPSDSSEYSSAFAESVALIRTKAQSFEDTGSKRIDNDVGIGDELLNDRNARFGFGIDSDRTLISFLSFHFRSAR
jgi:hypothetical protein